MVFLTALLKVVFQIERSASPWCFQNLAEHPLPLVVNASVAVAVNLGALGDAKNGAIGSPARQFARAKCWAFKEVLPRERKVSHGTFWDDWLSNKKNMSLPETPGKEDLFSNVLPMRLLQLASSTCMKHVNSRVLKPSKALCSLMRLSTLPFGRPAYPSRTSPQWQANVSSPAQGKSYLCQQWPKKTPTKQRTLENLEN